MLVEQFGGIDLSENDIKRAIDEVRMGKLGGHHTPSRNTYILCPVTDELWDIKPIVRRALENARATFEEDSWVTTRFQPQLSRLGFTILKFATESRRELGLRGYNPNALRDDHVALLPPDQTQIKNWLHAAGISSGQIPAPQRKAQNTNPFIRNSQAANAVRQASNGFCGACNQRTFQKESGEWFVEVHHKKWLREGGLDEEGNLVALCPNCHRKEHHSSERKFY